MTKQEKVIRGLESLWGCISPVCHTCRDCPYQDNYVECKRRVVMDTLTLLKEQDEDVAPIESTTKQKEFADRIGLAVSDFWCGACHFNLVGHPKFCPNCGKKVKWNE